MKRTIKKSQKDDKGGATALISTKEDTAWANRPVFSGFLGGNVRNIYNKVICLFVITCISVSYIDDEQYVINYALSFTSFSSNGTTGIRHEERISRDENGPSVGEALDGSFQE